ncbi:MAG TPA: hypothetical protein PLE19_05140 [Planctomycetota bacterium]|nr:hypothetical protein [Planctomycetota bacterium]HRR79840.1 hypothetical protein [Planctomycetota bacterium]HRT92916.1 hypothetical protein [Planctomycetota bacterium]
MKDLGANIRPAGPPLRTRLREEVCRAERHALPLTLVLFRVAPRGNCPGAPDDLIRAAVALTRAVVRRSDVVGPLDGSRFGVVANTTAEGAGCMAAALARHLEAFEFGGPGGPVTLEVSYSLCSLDGAKTADGLFDEAHAGLPEPR